MHGWNCQLAVEQVEMQVKQCLVNLYADLMCLGPITCQQQQSNKSKSACSVFELINDKFDIFNVLRTAKKSSGTDSQKFRN